MLNLSMRIELLTLEVIKLRAKFKANPLMRNIWQKFNIGYLIGDISTMM